MTFTKKDLEVIREIHYSTTLTEAQIKECFRGMAVAYTNALHRKEKITIPLFGEFLVKFKGKESHPIEGTLIDLSIFSTPAEQLKQIASQVDEERQTSSVNLTDSFKWLFKRFKLSLRRNVQLNDSEK